MSAAVAIASGAKQKPQAITQDEAKKLQSTVQFMDCLAQDGMSHIAAIAKLALAQLERPEGYLHTEVIASALEMIWHKADDIGNCISTQAEDVGCSHVDEAQARRHAARRAALEREVLP